MCVGSSVDSVSVIPFINKEFNAKRLCCPPPPRPGAPSYRQDHTMGVPMAALVMYISAALSPGYRPNTGRQVRDDGGAATTPSRLHGRVSSPPVGLQRPPGRLIARGRGRALSRRSAGAAAGPRCGALRRRCGTPRNGGCPRGGEGRGAAEAARGVRGDLAYLPSTLATTTTRYVSGLLASCW